MIRIMQNPWVRGILWFIAFVSLASVLVPIGDRLAGEASRDYARQKERVNLPLSQDSPQERKVSAAISFWSVEFRNEITATGGMPAQRLRKLEEVIRQAKAYDEQVRNARLPEDNPKMRRYRQVQREVLQAAEERGYIPAF